MTTQLLTGIPGTGKTHHLTERALRYLADGNDPARLLILAPTRTAATRMRDTIAASSDRSLSVAPTRAWAAYAFDLLKRAQTRGLLSGVEGNLKLLSGPEQDVIIGELLANHAEGIAPGPAWPDVLRDALPTRGFRHEIRDFFDRMAEYDLTADDVHALATEHNQPAWHALAQLHTEYRAVRALRAKNAYDPAVLINDACRLLLRAPEFLAEERRRYDLILIDDVQELSPSIYRLLRLIAAEEPPADAAHLTETHPDLFAEGPQVVMTYSDEAVVQGFRGARPDLVTTLQASFPSMRTRTLTTSYRLPALMMPFVADIRRRLPRYTRFVPLTAEQEGAKDGVKSGAPATFGRINTTPADEALTWGTTDEPLLHLGADGKILDPAHYRTAPAGVYKYALSSSQDEANLIAQMLLEERIYGNHPYRESAIIVRNGADVARIRRVLSSNGIPSRTSAALVPVRDEPAVRPFLDALSLLVYARKRGEKALNPAVHMPAGEGTEARERPGYEALSAAEAEELMRRSLNDVIAEESRANPLGGAQSAITLLTSRLGGASSMDVRRLRQQLRSIELQSGGHRPSDDLLLGALLHPETLPEEGVGRAVHRIAAVLSAGRKALARPESTSTEVLWALWEASGLEKTWVAQSRGAGPDADAAHRNLDAMIGLFEAADRFDEQMRGAGAEQFLDFIDAQDLPMDTLAARGVRQDAVEILTPALAAGQSWRTVYVCGLQEGTWPNTTVRGSLLSTGDLTDLCDARLRQRAQQAEQQPGESEQPVPPARIRSYPERVRDTRHDELRMFAVAATRASTRLVLTAVRNDDEAPGEFFDFVLPTDAVGDSTDVPITRVRRPATLRSLVAELRRTLVEESMNAMRAEEAQDGAPMHNAPEEETLTPEASAYRLDAASRTLARLANAQAPGAAPDEWWGLLPLSSTELLFAHRPADHAELDENHGEEHGEEQAENPAENPGRRTITLSPSRLETIHSSPLDWLVSAARAEAQTDLSRSLGTLVHAIAEEYPTGTLEELQTALDERISSLGVPARKEDETDEEYRERVPWESYALYERAKRMILRLSYYYRQHMGDAGWQNLGVEGSFAVRVPVPFDPAGEVGELDALLTGRVDRLEGTAPAEDGTRRYAIVDLKTGKSKPTGSEMETHPQLAAYQIAVEAGAGAQLEERYRAEAAALEAGEPLPDARPQELEYTGYTGHSAGAALVQLGASGVTDESKTRLQVQPALTEHDSWAAELVQHAAELIAGSQVQARHREGGYGCRLPEICPICTRGRQVTQP
ncbi:UrvD/REP family ATP-dependent DNA helicase [Rothia sp. HMSC064F07]|uniref:UrvD/REP family ATP-dependent DNA helicase n=1 Tax=Rothia sp. HMSC064F07 TaxID=1715191 RepID=UPI0008A8D96C|nr:UrvD/REP family ATP-dependent DNA helicase [Rothia sp. HMSC064F07]OHQ12457.1 ATP-dependent DNA helicase [Rothia sp. HMSC064F07]